jgi:hypothetical protein
MNRVWFWLFLLHYGSGILGSAYVRVVHEVSLRDEMFLIVTFYSYVGFFATIALNEICKAIRERNRG